MAAELDVSETNETIPLRMIIKPSAASVGNSTLSCAPQDLSENWSIGSRTIGEVIARAVSVHALPASGRHRLTASRRSAAMRSLIQIGWREGEVELRCSECNWSESFSAIDVALPPEAKAKFHGHSCAEYPRPASGRM